MKNSLVFILGICFCIATVGICSAAMTECEQACFNKSLAEQSGQAGWITCCQQRRCAGWPTTAPPPELMTPAPSPTNIHPRCKEIVMQLIRGRISYMSSGERPFILDEIELKNWPAPMVDLVNHYMLTGSDAALAKFQSICNGILNR